MNSNQTKLEARAALSAYIVLGGPLFSMGILSVLIALSHPERGTAGMAAICFIFALLWVAWVRGFRIRVTAHQIEYRDGFYRSFTVPLSAIRRVKNTWVEWRTFGRHLQIPRLVIVYGTDRNFVAINPKPFKLKDLRTLLTMLQTLIAEK